MSESVKTPDSGRKLFYGLFIFPLVIAVGMAVLLCGVVLLTHEEETPETLLAGLKKTSPSKRWQKAFELSNEINRHPEKINNPALYREMLQILGDREHADAKTRGYVALALAQAKNEEVAEALLKTLDDPKEEYLVYAVWAIAQLGDKKSVPNVEVLLNHESAEVRKVAAYALGVLGERSSVSKVTALLRDASADVRWNAALALARLGSAEGYDVILEMLQRDKLSNELRMDETQIESAMTNAIKGLVLIPNANSIKILETLSQEDKNMKVRQTAISALGLLEKKL